MTTKDTTEQTRDRIRGCLIGGAVGDALGYPVEFLSYSQIIHSFGEKGITEYALDVQEGKAVISDDTQMTLFTAEGLLNSAGKKKEEIPYEVYRSYLNWYQTQRGRRKPEMGKGKAGAGNPGRDNSRLMEIPELYVCRAPGNTCLSALSSGRMGDMEESINMSKGCGGIMRAARRPFTASRMRPLPGRKLICWEPGWRRLPTAIPWGIFRRRYLYIL